MDNDKFFVLNVTKITSKKLEHPLYCAHVAYINSFDGQWNTGNYFGPESLMNDFKGPGIYDFKMGPREALLKITKVAEVKMP